MRRMIRVLTCAVALAAPAAAQVPLDGVAAVVGEDVILRSELDLAAMIMAQRIEQQAGQISAQQYGELRSQALRDLIDDRVIMTVARRMEAVASDEEIDEAVASIAADEGVEPEEIYGAAAAQGLDREAYREQLATQMTRMRVVQGAVRSRISVTEEQVRELYKRRYLDVKPGRRIRVLHMLLPIPDGATPEQVEQMGQVADQLRQQAMDTGDFAGLTRRYSAAPTAPDGGLTVFREGDAPPQIEAALADMVPGEVTPLIRTEHGFNLFQYLDSFDPSKIAFEDVADQLRAELIERQTLPEFEKWLAEIREGQYIEVINPAPL